MPRTATSRKTHTKLKTNAQVGRIFGLATPIAGRAGIETKDFIEQTIAHIVTRPSSLVPSISQLTFDEANLIIKALGGDPFTAYGKSIRTINYRKQAAGIKSIETDAQLKLIRSLASERNMTDDGLTKLATRMNLPWPPNTTEQGNKITEALKAMNNRDATNRERGFSSSVVKGDFGPKPQAPSPAFRRVA